MANYISFDEHSAITKEGKIVEYDAIGRLVGIYENGNRVQEYRYD